MNSKVESNDCNHYNHYWMQAIIKNGWADENKKVSVLNTQDLFFKLKPNESHDFTEVFKKIRKEKTYNILGSKVISIEIEKAIGVPQIEDGILSFLRNRNNNQLILLSDDELLKRYCHLQVVRNPMLYDLMIADIDKFIELEAKVIESCGGEFTYLPNKSLKIQSHINSMVELLSQDKFYLLKMNNKKVKVIDISQYNTGFVIGDMTFMSFTSNINNKLVIDSFIEYNNIKLDISELRNSYIYPITQSSFIYLYQDDSQLDILNTVLEKVIFYQNKLQLELSSKVILPNGIPEHRIFNKMVFQHSLQLEKVRSYLDNNLIMLLNNDLNKKDSNGYFKDYEKTLEEINSLGLVKKSSFAALREDFKNIFDLNDNGKISFGLLNTSNDLEYLCKDIFTCNIKDKKYIFYIMRNGSVLYSINNKGFKLFCLDYFDFNSRFLVEIAINKFFLPLNLIQVFKDILQKSYLSSWKKIAEKCLDNAQNIKVTIEFDFLKNKEL